ncbi:MAG: phenylalanine--tRNA ligase subunit beta [Nitrososphaeraceae archaeon]|jgi:phenylalanyl-tRNA synthetase beta chain
MPVVNFTIKRLNKLLPGIDLNQVLELLPFIGLDIEGVDSEVLRIEYNPNRPDFASDYGIVRALRGLLEIETGLPKFKLNKEVNKYSVNIDNSVRGNRPYIVALIAKSGTLGNGTIMQLEGMKDDLQNGIGRGRTKASIGIHNMDAIEFPVRYSTVNEDFSFVPLEQKSSQTIKSILKTSNIGKDYGHILEGVKRYPLIIDSKDNVLAFPPIINGDITKVNANNTNLFIEVTGNNRKTVEDILAILAITLYDAGFELQNVTINNFDGDTYTPKMDVSYIDVDASYVNMLLGLESEVNEIIRYLKKSRLDAKETKQKKIIECCIPRYRIDILNYVDIAEEVAIGYGIYNLKPTIPLTALVGQKDLTSTRINIIRNTMVGLQILEIVNFSLVSKKIQYELPGIDQPDNLASVRATKSSEHEVLRDMLLPSLLKSLSRNVHEEYPQKLFEIGKTFEWSKNINEYWSLGAVVAHNTADYTEVKSIMHTLLKLSFGKSVTTKVATHPIFINGRCANIIVDEESVGIIGEITPFAIDNFKVRVPVAAFELNISKLLRT